VVELLNDQKVSVSAGNSPISSLQDYSARKKETHPPYQGSISFSVGSGKLHCRLQPRRSRIGSAPSMGKTKKIKGPRRRSSPVLSLRLMIVQSHRDPGTRDVHFRQIAPGLLSERPGRRKLTELLQPNATDTLSYIEASRNPRWYRRGGDPRIPDSASCRRVDAVTHPPGTQRISYEMKPTSEISKTVFFRCLRDLKPVLYTMESSIGFAP